MGATMSMPTATHVAAPSTSQDRVEMLRRHLQILKDLHAPSDILAEVERAIVAAQSRVDQAKEDVRLRA